MSVRARAWTALLLPPLAWFAFEQGLSHVLHLACERAWIGLVWGAASLLLCAAAMRVGWSIARHADKGADPWIARAGVMMAGIFALATFFQTLAVALVPPCVA